MFLLKISKSVPRFKKFLRVFLASRSALDFHELFLDLSYSLQEDCLPPVGCCKSLYYIHTRGAQYQYFIINSISIILVSFLSIPISISIILKRAYQYQYLINFSKSSFINFNINLLYQCPTMILIRLPISYQLVIVLNINIDIN